MKVVNLKVKYGSWVLVAVLSLLLIWSFWAAPTSQSMGTIDLNRIVEESPRAHQLNQLLSERFEELILEFNLDVDEEDDEPDRPERERQAYSTYLAYRQELEIRFEQDVTEAVREVAKEQKVTLVLDEDVVRYGGVDLSSEVIKKLQ